MTFEVLVGLFLGFWGTFFMYLGLRNIRIISEKGDSERWTKVNLFHFIGIVIFTISAYLSALNGDWSYMVLQIFMFLPVAIQKLFKIKKLEWYTHPISMTVIGGSIIVYYFYVSDTITLVQIVGGVTIAAGLSLLQRASEFIIQLILFCGRVLMFFPSLGKLYTAGGVTWAIFMGFFIVVSFYEVKRTYKAS